MANKKNLTKAVAVATGKTQKDSKVIVEVVMDVIKDALASGEDVKLVNFGIFKVAQRKERKGTNPKTLAPMVIPAKTVIRFKAGKGLADVVNA